MLKDFGFAFIAATCRESRTSFSPGFEQSFSFMDVSGISTKAASTRAFRSQIEAIGSRSSGGMLHGTLEMSDC